MQSAVDLSFGRRPAQVLDPEVADRSRPRIENAMRFRGVWLMRDAVGDALIELDLRCALG